MRGDEVGFFWFEKPRTRTRERRMPPIPDTGWSPPEEFPDLSNADVIAIDCETYDPKLRELGPGMYRDGYICGVAVGAGDFRAYYPIAHEAGPNLPRKMVFEWLGEELSRPRQPKLGANLLYDAGYLLAAGVPIDGPLWDVQVAEPILNETRMSYALDALGRDYLGEGKVESELREWLETAFGRNNVKGNIYRAPPAVVGPYAESDVDMPIRIFDIQRERLHAEGLWDLFELESSLMWLLLRMKQRGVRVDTERTEQLRDQLIEQRKELEKEIKDMTGHVPNVWANDSLARMFDALDIPYPRTAPSARHPNGQPSFRKDWLEHHTHPLAKKINGVRHKDKLVGTFLEGYILEGNVNGRIHTSFHPLRGEFGGTETGRFSSSNPNLQNIPVRSEEGKLIRSLFIAEEGQDWWKFDWSQIEYRLIVHFAAAAGLRGADQAVQAYINDPDTDYHQLVANMTGLQRREAKNLNFGLAYGLGVESLCEALGVDMETGKAIIDTYHERNPYVRALATAMERAAARRGYIRTLLGRRRRFLQWELNGEVTSEYRRGARRAFTRKAMNSGIQGSAADIMKKAMRQLLDSGALDVLGAPHLTVHDELDGSKPRTKEGDEALAEVKHIMESCVTLRVPMRADGGTGPNWGSIE